MASDIPRKKWELTSGFVHVCVLLISAGFWLFIGQISWWRTVLAVGLSFACFTIGSLAGFLFTSYGEETSTLGKVRDWLVGGLTGLTVANSGAIKALLLTFSFGPGPREFAITTSVAITYLGLGFFYMFFQRELIFNVLLARSRALRGQLDGTKQAGIATQKLLAGLPPALLAGIDTLDDTIEERKSEFEALRTILYADDVSEFLKQADEALSLGTATDWDVVAKAAYLNYYRTYYEKGEKREPQEEKAGEWILRALMMNPLHGDLTARYADVLWMRELYADAVATLERLMQSPEAPAYVQQWLGYFLLFVESREDDTIRLSQDYHKRFPDETDTFFNIANAYAKKYSQELMQQDVLSKTDSENRRRALENLKSGLKSQPDFAKTLREDSADPDDFLHVFFTDREFREIVKFESTNAKT
ncbi:MAG TPA: hypothetical protein VHW46_16825 [Terracidiphilus sp.]|jgi:tetratricopeptide (TPR) repeat protein|nr:hypothetical protein [Terracidiphilus sp.]